MRPAGRLDLGAQAREVRLEPEQVGVGLGRPAGTGQLQVRDDVAVRPDQRLEQAELGGRQRQRGLADARLVASRLEDERPASSGPPAGPPPAPGRSTRRMIAAIRASSSALPNGLVR